MQQTKRNGRVQSRTILLATGLVVIAFAVGFAFAAGINFTNGTSESAVGDSHATGSPTWWTEQTIGVGIEGASVPVLSTSMSAPTQLGSASSSFSINPEVSGDWVHEWRFTEAAGAPSSTELQIDFTIVENGGTVQTTSFVETQATSPESGLNFTMSYDLGSATITLDSVVEVSQTCPSVGNCI
jgi:hypothetical protein